MKLFKEDLLAEQISNIKNLSKALREGEYKQAKGTLRNGGSFCCLGVACDLLEPEKWKMQEPNKAETKNEAETKIATMMGCEKGMPVTIMKKYGFLDEIGTFVKEDPNELTITLAHLNDNGHSFEEIAEIIENQLNSTINK